MVEKSSQGRSLGTDVATGPATCSTARMADGWDAPLPADQNSGETLERGSVAAKGLCTSVKPAVASASEDTPSKAIHRKIKRWAPTPGCARAS